MYQIFCFVWFAALIAFIVFWWKKRKAKKESGDDYQNSEKYLDFSKKKRIIGFVCIGAFALALITQPELTPEEKARMNAWYEKNEQKELAEKVADKLYLEQNADKVIEEAIQIKQEKDESIDKEFFLFDYKKEDAEKDIKKTFKNAIRNKLKSVEGFEKFDEDDDVEFTNIDVHVPKGGFADIYVKFNWTEKNNPFHKKGYTNTHYKALINPDRTWRINGSNLPKTTFN